MIFYIPTTLDYLHHRTRPPPPLAQLMSSDVPCAGNGGGTEGAEDSRAHSRELLNRMPETQKDLETVMSGRPAGMEAACGLVGEARIGEPDQRPQQEQEI